MCMLEHGGRLRIAAQQYDIALSDWLDLSTGINPNGWPVPAIPDKCWQRLPEDEDGLLTAARNYYGNDSLLAVAGSQAAIQSLPQLRTRSLVGVLHPAYAEHGASWRKAGHAVHELPATSNSIDTAIDMLDVLILINPNNPTGTLWPVAQLLDWYHRLAERGGWLIVDEAFLDGLAQSSLATMPTQPGLLILRSMGKFFGLAGIRCGFVIGEPSLLRQLAELLGPWTLSHPSRHVATLALQDVDWQYQARIDLDQQGRRLSQLLSAAGLPPSGGCDLFQWIQTPMATLLHETLAKQGILTRLFTDPASLRFGLPQNETGWQRLRQALMTESQFNTATI